MQIIQKFQFNWINLTLLAVFNISLSFILIYFYKQHQQAVILFLLLLVSLVSTAAFLLMINSIAPTNKYLRWLTLFMSLMPFLALPLIAFLWYLRKGVSNPYFSRYKIVLLLGGSLIALTLSLEPTEFLSKKELLIARILPSELALPILSSIETNRVSAITPFDSITTSCATAKVKKIRNETYPQFSTSAGMNPNGIFRVLPLGLSWVRGAPAHAAALIHFHYLMR